MNHPLISIIVPVYKVENYLNRCVDSIVNQTYKNLEIILVDDGSPDNCGKLCDELAETDARIRVVHKQNGGLASARNAGLEIATGDYVGFIDSDDWIEHTMYETLSELIIKNDCQISACGIQCDHPNGTHHFFNSNYPKQQNIEKFTKKQAIKELIQNYKITNSACDKLFAKQLFENLRFTEGIIYEDFDLMPRCIEQVENVVYTPVPMYHYVMTDTSITRGEFKESRFMMTTISRRNMQHYKENYPEFYTLAAAKHIELCLVLIYDSSKSNFSKERKILIKEIKNSRFKKIFGFLDKRNKIKYIFAKINISLFVFIMSLKDILKQVVGVS